jgi:AcrR family transcriptional regulator
MSRPDLSVERRRRFAPVLARVFAAQGYRRTTTAELAQNCGVQEPILYRLWPDKQAMFVAALDHVYRFSETTWTELIAAAGAQADPAVLILEYEATHHGEFGLYRIVFAGLSETDDPAVRRALRRLYEHFRNFVEEQLRARGVKRRRRGTLPDPELASWAILGLGTAANIGRELGLLSPTKRKRLFREIGRLLLGEA